MRKLRKISLLWVWLFLNIWYSLSQTQIPIEITVGHSGYYYQHSFSTRFLPEKPIGFFHTSSILIPYNKNRGNEIMSQSYISYAMNNYWNSGIGSIFTPLNRVRPSVFFQYFQKVRTTSVLIYPRIDIWSNPNLEIMGIVEYHGLKFRPINLYARFQYMTTWNRNGHVRSYQYARLGLDIADLKIGLAVNFDQYGSMGTLFNNFGLFVHRNF